MSVGAAGVWVVGPGGDCHVPRLWAPLVDRLGQHAEHPIGGVAGAHVEHVASGCMKDVTHQHRAGAEGIQRSNTQSAGSTGS